MSSPLDLLCSWVSRQAGDEAEWFAKSINQLKAGAPERDLHIVLGLAPRKLGREDLD